MSASDRDGALKELGRVARERREETGLSLEDIYERTRVRVEFLQGIERGCYDGFPDLVYIKGFVRTYLGIVGAEDLKEEFMLWLNKDIPKDRLSSPTNVLGNGTLPTKGFKTASRFWLFSALFLALLGAGAYVWYAWTNNPIVIADRRLQEPPSTPFAVASEDTASADILTASSPDLTPIAILPASAGGHSQEARVEEPLKPSILIEAKGDVWIRVMINDRELYARTLKAGNAASWDLPSAAKITFGRPNRAEVTLNGKVLGVVNPKGSRKSETYLYNPDGSYKKVQ